jgi:pimeloyl-ACP methyl ester carboxylesterase
MFTSADGTSIQGWCNDGIGVPLVVSNGLGTPPEAWPALVRPGSGFRVWTWYYRGTGGSARPADPRRIGVTDHMADLHALVEHQHIERAVVACWSLGVNVAFEFARRHPERVAGLFAVAGVPGGTFRAMGGPLRIPHRLRQPVSLAATHLLRRLGPGLSWASRRVPLTERTVRLLRYSGMLLPPARSDVLIPALREFRRHDFRWYFTLAIEAAKHQPMDLSFVEVPTMLVAGRYDLLTSMQDMVRACQQIPAAELTVLPGSHFLPLEFPEELAERLRWLVERTDVAA